MNCQLFNTHIPELVRGEMMETQLKADCLRHAEECADCRLGLADERAMHAALKNLAMADEGRQAPAAIERQLLAAYRMRHETPVAGRQPRQQWLALAAAALILIALGAALMLWPDSPRPAETAETAPAPAPRETRASDTQSLVVAAPAETPRPLGSRPRVRPARNQSPPLVIRDEMTLYADDEVMTDYLLLNAGQRLQPMERGQVVRVALPRSVLGSFGLPVNPDRTMVPVKADLLVGEDGMARAIRFVR